MWHSHYNMDQKYGWFFSIGNHGWIDKVSLSISGIWREVKIVNQCENMLRFIFYILKKIDVWYQPVSIFLPDKPSDFDSYFFFDSNRIFDPRIKGISPSKIRILITFSQWLNSHFGKKYLGWNRWSFSLTILFWRCLRNMLRFHWSFGRTSQDNQFWLALS